MESDKQSDHPPRVDVVAVWPSPISAGTGSAVVVAELQQRKRLLQLLLLGDAKFQVSGPKVPDVANIPGEPFLKGDVVGVDLQVDQQRLGLRMDLDTREVLQP